MSQSDISIWLKFALQQMASESYLDQLLLGRPLRELLLEGNNDTRFVQPDLNGNLPGKTRFTNVLADQFLDRYQILNHHANDATGFSATLMRDTTTGEYTLSFRSTESAPATEGGDQARDLFGADVEIGTSGFAFGQLVAMEEYYQSLKASGALPTGAVLNVTGFSLGGHLATVFTELHEPDVTHTYIFNAAGRGHVPGAVPGLSAEETRIQDMLSYFRSVLDDPDNALGSFPRTPTYDQAKALYDGQGTTWHPFDQGSTNLYSDARYEWAKAATQALFNPSGLTFLRSPGEVQDQGPFAKITQLYGQATTDDLQFIANAGVHAPAIPVFIEGQPLIAGGLLPSLTESGNTHSITLIVDSLATQELIQTIDSRYGQASVELLIKATSNAKADTFAPLNVSGVAEGDSLEKTVDALRKVFVGPDLNPLPVDSTVGGFGNLAFRNELYTAIGEVQDAVTAKQAQGVVFTITDLTDPAVDRASILARADVNTVEGLAYRYGLKELNPFIVTAHTEFETGALYTPFNLQGELDRYDPATGAGRFTTFYMDDRAAFLKEKVALNQADRDISSGSIYFFDASQAYEIATTGDPSTTRQFLFGSNGEDRFESGSKDDDLYGGAGVDLLIGHGGNDYLQGDGGGDQLEGGAGSDRLVGGAGVDVLDGGTENDTLDGGLDNDILKGGTGLDRYLVRAIDGADTIEDSDGKGVVEFDGKVLLSGLRRTDDPATVFHSADGSITYTKQGADLVVTGSGPLTIKNFATGLFGITLFGEADYAPVTRTEFQKIDHYIQVGNDANGNPLYEPVYAPFFDDNANDAREGTPLVGGLTTPLGDENNLLHALGGADTIISGAGDDQLYGDGGSDELYGGLGHDRLYGGGEDDQVFGDNVAVSTSGGDDFLDGGEGNDLLQGGAGRDILFGGAGNDNLNGDEFAGDNAGGFEDYLDGGAGDDELHGAAGRDVLIGGMGNDLLIGDTTQFQNGTPEQGGDDSLDGGEGQDQLFGLYGDDLLVGGMGNDLVNGQDGSDVLYGGAGDDTLSGDLRFTSLTGGYDLNEYRAAGGDDLLFGEDGNDIMIGGEGDDRLDGDIGDDSLFGAYNTAILSFADPLYWSLFTVSGNDWINAGPGSDVLSGGIGADTLAGGEGADILYGAGGDDSLEGGPGDDILFGEYNFRSSEFVGNPFLSNIRTLAGRNTLDGGDGNDQLFGGGIADTLLGGGGNDRVFDNEPDTGTLGGNDVLLGGSGNDWMESWHGDDVLHGDEGNDLLVSHLGADVLFGDEGEDRLVAHMASGSPSVMLYGGPGNDVYELQAFGGIPVESFGEGIDRIEVGWSYTLPDNIEHLTTGGTGIGNALDNVILGTMAAEGREGNDTLIGAGRLDGGVGDDLLQGGSRIYIAPPPLPPPPGGVLGGGEPLPPPVPTIVTNAYVFGLGYGHDTIQEMDPEFNSAYYQNHDTVEFLSGIAPSDVTWQRDGNNLELSVHGGADRLTIQSFYDLSFNVGGYTVRGAWVPPQGFETTIVSGALSYYAHSRVELFKFSDGTVWTAEHFGAPLLGDFRADTYQFGRGAGEITVLDFDPLNDPLNKEMDTIRVGTGVSAADLSVSLIHSNDLMLSINGTDDRLIVQSFLANVAVIPPFTFPGYDTVPYQIEQIQFDDGASWSLSDLFSRISTISGTATMDSLSGNNRDNLIQGFEGDDSLYGSGGNDMLDGGAGNDRVFGGVGNDTYLFNLGDGIDTIEDTAATGEGNRIQFGAGIGQDEVAFTHDAVAQTVTIHVGSSGTDQLVLTNFDPTGTTGSLVVETVAFADGSAVNLADLFPSNHAPTIATLLADQTIPEDAPFRLVVPADTFADQDADDILTLSASLADGTALPAWLTFDATTATLSGAPDDAQVGALDLRVTATDTGNLTVSDGFTLTVQNVNEAPTVANPLAAQRATEDAPLSLIVPANTFADVDAGDSLAYSATLAGGAALPIWLSFDSATQTFSGTPLNNDVGNLNIAVTATDTGNLTASDAFTLTIQNVNDTPMVANPLADQSAAEDTPFSFTVPGTTFADVDAIHGDHLTYGATLADGSPLPSWLSFNPTTRTLSGAPQAGDAGVLQIAVTAIDQQAAGVSDQFSLTISGPLPQTLTGTAGHDILTGGRGDDTLSGLAGNDQLNGGQGDDLLDGGTGTDTMQGGAGDDTYIVDASGDIVTELANEGTDLVQSAVSYQLSANVEDLTLTGTAALNGTGNTLDNVLVGNSANNTLTGGAGHDWLDGGLGSDTMIGGIGDDTYIVNQVGDVVTENFNQGIDTVESAITFTLTTNLENLALTGTANLNGTGSSANNVLLGNSGNNTLDGGSGNDTADGGAGDDSVHGGSGDDALLGGLGDDMLNAGSGNDTLSGGDGVDALDGGSGDDQLLGGAGNDTMTGGSGADQFMGGVGNDILTGGSGNDQYYFSRGDGQDTIIDTDPFPGNQDHALFGATINPLDLVISRQANDLRLAIHGSSDQVTVQNWYLSNNNRIETLQAGNGQTLLSTQVDQLIQAMAGFTQQTGLTWDEGIDQQPQAVQTILAASWQ